MSKITLLFISIFLCFAQVAISQEAIKITIELEGQSLKSALCKLGEASRYQFIFQDEIPDTLVVTNQNFEDKALFQILDVLLADSGFGFAVIRFMNSSTVIIYRISETIQSQELALTTITVAGQVLDMDGRPAWSAPVIIKKEGINCLSTAIFADDDGFFVITVDNPNTYLIVLSDATHLPRVVHIRDAELIQLEPDKESLERIFIIGCPCRIVEE